MEIDEKAFANEIASDSAERRKIVKYSARQPA
jgi:hypothetical protein